MLEEALPAGDARLADDRDSARHAARLAAGFTGLLAATLGLIVLGALVRAHEAGLACPDWPLCFGEVVPRMDLRVAFEWTHRAVAGSVAVVFSVLAVLALRRPRSRDAAALPVFVGFSLLSLQILLGALTVWQLLAPWTVTAHLLTGNAFSLTLLLIVLALRDAAAGRPPRPAAPAGVRALLGAAAVLLALQILLGGLVSSRFAGLACPDWPACQGGAWFPSWQGNVGLHLLHRLNGYALVLALAAAAAAAWHTRLRAATALALALVLAQVAVGVANVRLGIPVELTGLHSALAAALVLALTFAVREMRAR